MEVITVLNRKRGSVKSQITRIESTLTSLGVEEIDLVVLETKLNTVSNIKSSFEEIRAQYYEILEDDELEANEQEFEAIDERLEAILIKIKRLIQGQSTSSDPARFRERIKLPEIPLPQFSGNYEEWNLFKTQFNSLILSNTQLSENQKLYYLQAALRGEAKQVQTTDDTFESLMKALQNR